ncbi:MAG: NfeD family protein, partial [Gaiellales bacterium]
PRNWTAREAVAAHVADVVAPSLPSLLRQIDGRRIGFKQLTVHVADARLDYYGVPWTTELLLILTNANLLGLLFLAGILGIAFELIHPGIVLPGLLGGVSLLLALLGLSIVPFSWVGIALLGLGLILLAAEAHVPTHGAFAAVGALSAALGGFMLFRVDGSPYGTISPVPLVLVTAVALLVVLLVARKVIQARLLPPFELCNEALVGSRATVLTPLARAGQVLVHGERWGAVADDGSYWPGEQLIVTKVDGLTLHVAGAVAAPAPPPPSGRLERDAQPEPIPARGAR